MNYKTQAKFNFSSVYKATTLLQQVKDVKGKGKVIPLQAPCGPEGE